MAVDMCAGGRRGADSRAAAGWMDWREGAGATWPTVRQRVVILGGFLYFSRFLGGFLDGRKGELDGFRRAAIGAVLVL